MVHLAVWWMEGLIHRLVALIAASPWLVTPFFVPLFLADVSGPSIGSIILDAIIAILVGLGSGAGVVFITRRGQNVAHEDARESNAIKLGQTAYERLTVVENQMAHVMATNAAQQTQITELFNAYLMFRDRFERLIAYFRLRPEITRESEELRLLLFSPLPAISFSPGGTSPPVITGMSPDFSSSGASDASLSSTSAPDFSTSTASYEAYETDDTERGPAPATTITSTDYSASPEYPTEYVTTTPDTITYTPQAIKAKPTTAVTHKKPSTKPPHSSRPASPPRKRRKSTKSSPTLVSTQRRR